MDKKFNIQRASIKKQAPAFMEFLRQFVLDDFSFNVLKEISSSTDVYIFSGVIRNYLLGEPISRDIDIVVRDLPSVKFSKDILGRYQITRNSFGGYKILTDNLVIDIWDIERTWSLLQNPNLKPTPHTLIKTAFFNFSAILFDVKLTTFIYGEDFLRFYANREIDVVNELNPNEALCIVNTMYYAIKLESPIKYRLCKWIVDHYKHQCHYEQAQLSHFHKIIYGPEVIEKFFEKCIEVLPVLKQNPDNLALKISESSL